MLFVSAVNESAETSVGASGKNHLLIHVIVTVWHWGFNLGHSNRQDGSILQSVLKPLLSIFEILKNENNKCVCCNAAGTA